MEYPSLRINLHTHTNFCNHAVGGVKDYVEAAKKEGLAVLGLTEHAPVPGDPIAWNMMCRNLDSYVLAVNAEKTRDDLQVFLGGECDYESILSSYYRDELLGRCGFDYLICSIHVYFDLDQRKTLFVSRSKNFPKHLNDYVARYCSALESGLFLFGCHPDLFRASYLPWNDDAKAASKDILQCAHDLNIPLEINAAGLRKSMIEVPEGQRHPYSTYEFYEMAKDMGVNILLSSDAHDPKLVAANADGREMARRLGLEPLGCSIDESGKLSLKAV